jgi:C_GCAxxG_C_C family probable redox protein
VFLLSCEEEAKRNFNSGYNCAESVLLTTSRRLGHSIRNSESCIPRIATGFGGGIGRNGDVCGALSGGIIAISLALGRDNGEQSRDPCYAAADRFYTDFVEKFGSCRCRELTGVNLKTPEGRTTHLNRIHQERCNLIVAWAARKVDEIIANARMPDAPL